MDVLVDEMEVLLAVEQGAVLTWCQMFIAI